MNHKKELLRGLWAETSQSHLPQTAKDPLPPFDRGSRRVLRVPLKGTIRVSLKGSTRVPLQGSTRVPLKGSTRVPLKGSIGVLYALAVAADCLGAVLSKGRGRVEGVRV